MSKKLKLGVFGLGCVGQGFYELIEQSASGNFEIAKIVVKRDDKIRTIEGSILSTRHADIFDNPEIDIVVELIDDAETALEILRQSLRRRKPVVTANKKMLAENLEEIFQLQRQYQTPVLYEGSVCGSIPLVRNLESHYAFDDLTGIEGIFNGSTNYILTKMIEDRKDYETALQEAQQLGFAESDPTLDVQGFDPKYKLAITIAHAFGVFVKPDQILNLGIDHITTHDIQFAKQKNCTIKLVAKTGKIGNKIFGLVAPHLVPLENPLAQIRNEFNAINITGRSTGLQTMTGKGAGSLPTGLVVMSDAYAIAGGFAYQYSKVAKAGGLEFEEDVQVNVQVSFSQGIALDYQEFDEFNGGFQGPHFQTMGGWVSVKKLRNWATRKGLSILLNQGQNIRLKNFKKTEELAFI